MSHDQPENKSNPPPARVLGPRDGEILGIPHVAHDRFLISAHESGGGFALVEHLLSPHLLAAPLHRHSQEDEYSYVLEGRVGALLGDDVVFGQAGDLIFKPRGQWHTFWNAGDVPARILEIISPGGFEQLFRELDALGAAATPDSIAALGERYGVETDFEGTGPLIERYRLVFWA